jgi:multidrug efflux pump subunit AcrB
MGKSPMQAASDAAIEIGLAVVATSLTLCAVFIPVAFMNGIPGEFFKPFGFTATVAVLFSLLVARTLTPMMASRYMKAHDERETTGRWKTWYVAKVEWAMAHRKTTSLVGGLLIVAAIVGLIRLPTGFIPNEDQGYLVVSVQLPDASALERTQLGMALVVKELEKVPGVDRVVSIGGVNALSNNSSQSRRYAQS